MKDRLKAFSAFRVHQLIGAAALLICFSTNAFNNVKGVPSLNKALAVAPTTTTVSSSANPSVFGQSVTFTATVSTGGAGTPTGTVQFFDGLNPIGGSISLNASGQAQLSTSGLSVGNHSIAVSYSGDVPNGFDPSSGNLIGNPQVVNKANTTVGVTAFPSNPSGTGQTITFTATVNPVAPSVGTPAGSVTFNRNGSPVCSNVTLNAFGQATCNIRFTIAGNYNIAAQYGGSGNFNVSNNNGFPHVQQVIGPTAAGLSIGGRIRTALGRAVSFASVTMIGADGETRYERTNTFGYYRFDDVSPDTYVLIFRAKGFQPVSLSVNALDNVTDLNIVLQK